MLVASSGGNSGSFAWISPSLKKGWDKVPCTGKECMCKDKNKCKPRFPPYDVLVNQDNLVMPMSPFLNNVMCRMVKDDIVPPGGTSFSMLSHMEKKPPTAMTQISNWCRGYESTLVGVFTSPPRLCCISDCRQSPFIADVRRSIGDDHLVLEGPFWAFPLRIPSVMDPSLKSLFDLVVPNAVPLSSSAPTTVCRRKMLFDALLSCRCFRSSFGIRKKSKLKKV